MNGGRRMTSSPRSGRRGKSVIPDAEGEPGPEARMSDPGSSPGTTHGVFPRGELHSGDRLLVDRTGALGASEDDLIPPTIRTVISDHRPASRSLDPRQAAA